MDGEELMHQAPPLPDDSEAVNSFQEREGLIFYDVGHSQIAHAAAENPHPGW